MFPLVSVYCLAYNHEKYIRDTLEGFVKQKTNFPFEVIVHDDASTDNTAEIIKEYEAKYPNIIKSIIQSENQYSKGVPIAQTFIFPLIKGKYIAVCEGDDYWCEDNKLQLQVDWLENHQDYSLCVHNTKMINCRNGEERLINPGRENRDISLEEIVQWKGGILHTSSFMYRREYAVTPQEFRLKGVGDYPKAVYLAICGKVRYLSNVMSVYRYLVSGSWSAKISNSTNSNEKQIKHYQDRIQMLKNVNEYTHNKYSECITKAIKRNEFSILCRQNNIKKIKTEYSDLYKQLCIKDKMRMQMNKYCPGLMKI